VKGLYGGLNKEDDIPFHPICIYRKFSPCDERPPLVQENINLIIVTLIFPYFFMFFLRYVSEITTRY